MNTTTVEKRQLPPPPNEPRFPVIDPNPSFFKIVRNFAAEEYCIIGAVNGLSAAFVIQGLLNRSRSWGRMGMAAAGGVMSVSLGIAYFGSRERLMRFSAYDATPPSYPVIDSNPSFSKIVRNFNAEHYFVIGNLNGLVASCVIPEWDGCGIRRDDVDGTRASVLKF